MPHAIVNLKHEPDAVRNGAVRIDRRTQVGQPLRHRQARHPRRGHRALPRRALAAHPRGRGQLEELAALHGKTLACHCAPLPCHGEVLARAAAWAAAQLASRGQSEPLSGDTPSQTARARRALPRPPCASREDETSGAAGKPAWRKRREAMDALANPRRTRMDPRYVIRTIDEDWIDLFDPPSRIGDKRTAWEEANRRVRALPRVQDRRHRPLHRRHRSGGATPTSRRDTRSSPSTPQSSTPWTDGCPLPGDVLSSHKEKDDAWTAFYEAIEQPSGDIILLRDDVPPRRPSSRPRMRTSTTPAVA